MSFQVVEIVRTILFVGLFMILIAILYKRLLRAIGKDDKVRKYLELKEFSYAPEGSRLSFLFEVPKKDQVIVRLLASDNHVMEIFSGELEAGEQELSLEVEGLKSGKYEVKISASHLDFSMFFVVD